MKFEIRSNIITVEIFISTIRDFTSRSLKIPKLCRFFIFSCIRVEQDMVILELIKILVDFLYQFQQNSSVIQYLVRHLNH